MTYFLVHQNENDPSASGDRKFPYEELDHAKEQYESDKARSKDPDMKMWIEDEDGKKVGAK